MKPTDVILQNCLFIAGILHFGLVAGSLFVPKLLNWFTELSKVQPTIRQMFWTYAIYIACINTSFGLLSVFCYRDLTNGSTLAVAVNGFIAVYWLSRLCIQFFHLDRKAFPQGIWYRVGETALVTLFVLFSLVFSYATYFNIQSA